MGFVLLILQMASRLPRFKSLTRSFLLGKKLTFRTIDSILKVNKLAVTGDAIRSRYTTKAASAFNAAVGNAFTNEPDFRAALKVVTATYRQTTKVSLKF